MAKKVNIFDERYEFQQEFVEHLVNENKFIERTNKDFDRTYAMDTDLLFEFLYNTQKDVMQDLEKIYKSELRETLVNHINSEITKKGSSLIDVLKNGVEIANRKLELMYTKPATDFNKDLNEKYENNIFSVMQEVYATANERVDLVIFLNGLAIIAIELKSEYSGQTYHNAIRQFRTERDPKSRLFLWKAGCFVMFAMDTSEVMMTTKLDGQSTLSSYLLTREREKACTLEQVIHNSRTNFLCRICGKKFLPRILLSNLSKNLSLLRENQNLTRTRKLQESKKL